MQKQVLWLMFLLSKEPVYLHIPVRHTRGADKIQFKVPTRIQPTYEHSPYYIGTKLWNSLTKETQEKENIYDFKKEINRMYKVYKKI